MKKIMLLLGIVLLLAACTSGENEGGVVLPPNLDLEWADEDVEETEGEVTETEQETEESDIDYGLFTQALQLSPLTPGEELLIMHTTLGDITLRFFPTEAPIAVENFVTHARDGFYDGVIFHRVIEGFMIQTGCPLGTGTGGQSIWGGTFGQEISLNLAHFRGALAMAQTDWPNSIGSQFYIVQSPSIHPQTLAEFNSWLEHQDEYIGTTQSGRRVYLHDIHPAEILNHYIAYGGTPHLDMTMNENGHTVFGHVVEGMDVVDAIAAVPATNDRPNEDVIIIGFTFFIYGE